MQQYASVGFLFTLNYDARNHELKKLDETIQILFDVNNIDLFGNNVRTHKFCSSLVRRLIWTYIHRELSMCSCFVVRT